MNQTKVLVVDDDSILGNVIMLALKNSGFLAYYQTSLAGITAAINDICPNIIVMDVELGIKNGINEMPKLKLVAPNTPILFISSHTDASFVVKALEMGSVGYLKKPFEISELIAYIKRYAINENMTNSNIKIGRLILNLNENILSKDGVIIKKLSLTEFNILRLLILNKNKVVSKEKIKEEVWKDGNCSYESLNNFISRLRKYLSNDENIHIKTNNKKGFMLFLG
jgi:DNA-binding response OmpR family regulator